MERRVLGERLANPYHPLIIRMYHSFQDYNSLYFLMDLQIGGEVWATLRFRKKMVGCHPSLARFYLAELVEALEFIHSRGIVHRDLKAENMIISPEGHLILIDFGTAKDLVEKDFNGPEFVGTPDFMPPEAVKGTDEILKAGGADHTADLWALGCVIYQLLIGDPPFSAQSPYLSFLK
jgi:serine/threonine protein kinase